LTSSKAKKEETPDTEDNLWKTFNLNACATTSSLDIAGMTFNVDYSGGATAGNYTMPLTAHEEKVETLLNEIIKILIEIKNK